MNRAATLALAPLSILYGAVVKARAAFYRNGIFRTQRIAAPVISVGNLTTGGTGKTPLVEWIAQRLAAEDRRVCILTRGYGRVNSNRRAIVSDGNRIVANVDEAGDEALLLAEALKGKAVVICDADRVSAANWAIEKFGTDVVVLDDGFQNLRIARDLNIVTVNATDAWKNGWLFPAGVLREPIKSLRRADCIILTRVTQPIDPELLKQIHETSKATVLTSRMVTSEVRRLKIPGGTNATESNDLRTVAAFCAIGNPQAFFDHLRSDNFELVHTASFHDHHKYTQADLDRITQEAIRHGAEALITTAKDEVKLRSMRFDLPCYVLEIEIEISTPEKLLELIEQAILAKS
jgi:tetraacyldisaccharide 4'-kinase